MPLSAISFMAPLPAEQVTPETEGQMKEWLENYRAVRQRSVRSETTKDKAGALPPAVYQMAPQGAIPGQPWISMERQTTNQTTTIPTRGTQGMKLKCTMVRIQLRALLPTVLLTLHLSMTQKLEVCKWTNSNSIQMCFRGVSSSQRDKIRATRSSLRFVEGMFQTLVFLGS